MKTYTALAFFMYATFAQALDITLAKNIKSDLRDKINQDLALIKTYDFKEGTSPQLLKMMDLNALTSESASQWLGERVNYVISENALSLFSLLVKRTIFVERENVEYPFADLIPETMETNKQSLLLVKENSEEAQGYTVMSNIGTALYASGKMDQKLYGIKISRGLLKKAEKVRVTSPRAGVIQIGEGLFAAELRLNQNEMALANSIFRLGTFFHEARHSDGHGKSLGFMHALCPTGHDYENQPACDENLNGPYAIGTLMMAEMARSCDDACSEKDKQALRMVIIDNANRIIQKNKKGQKSTHWDATPESL